MLLQELLQWVAHEEWPADYTFPVLDSVPKLTHYIMDTAASLSVVCRLRRSMVKQVLDVSFQHLYLLFSVCISSPSPSLKQVFCFTD